jgi:DNA repair protein RecN (Recombination protein N)
MLTELHIENFAIIDRLEVQFKQGLITFTGETGAGKSIIIDALETILGGRADATLVRSGAERASVEGVFQISESTRPALAAILEREELLDDPNYLTLGREIRLNGRNVARVNGRSVSASLLREVSEYLVDVHGQSEHLSLLRVNQHRGLLDNFASSDETIHTPQPELGAPPLKELLETYSKSYRRLQAVRRDLAEIQASEQDAARRADILLFQIKEIEAARLREGEEEELRAERNRLANAESLASAAHEALQLLDEGTPEAPSVTDLFGQVLHSTSSLARLDPSQAELFEKTQILSDELNDLTLSLRNYLEGIEFNPKRLDQVEERLASIHSLKRKYGDTILAILAYGKDAQRQLDDITHASERIEELEAEQTGLLKQLAQEGQALSARRHAAAQKLERAIEVELADLHMAGARFKVDFQQREETDGVPVDDGRRIAFDASGLEKVEFLIAPNPGEGFKPLVKTASGGETSRLMLALKNVLAQADQIPTLVFDEIDQGIGGRVGGIVGEKLWSLARSHQVLCITHLPQLAVYGEQHFHVQKQLQAGRTTTQVRLLEDEERLRELALMLGEINEATLHSAHEMLRTAARRCAKD